MTNLKCRQTPYTQNGFTLVEVMIAITLLAVMLAITFNVLNFAARAWDKGVVRAEIANRVHVVQNLLRSVFAQAQPIVLDMENRQDTYLAFIGQENGLRFVAPLSSAQISGGMYVLNVEYAKREAQGFLLLRYQRYHYNEKSFETADPVDAELLLEDVEAVNFRYLGPDNEGDAVWHTEWLAQDVLPYSIELHVRFSRNDLEWPVLVVNPKMAEIQLLPQSIAS
ncbi:prepilin-type N-terminal cleavage/methylation domain-containing protein [Kaarinaea lacus]